MIDKSKILTQLEIHPYKTWSDEGIIEEIYYLIGYLEKERTVGACMSKRLMDALIDYVGIMEEIT